MGYEKNMSFLVIPKSPKVWKKVEKIGLGSFNRCFIEFNSSANLTERKCILLSTIQAEEKPEEKPEPEAPPEEPQPPEPAPGEGEGDGEGDADELDDGSEERQSPESPEFIIIEDVSMLILLGCQILGKLWHPKSCIRHI